MAVPLLLIVRRGSYNMIMMIMFRYVRVDRDVTGKATLFQFCGNVSQWQLALKVSPCACPLRRKSLAAPGREGYLCAASSSERCMSEMEQSASQ